MSGIAFRRISPDEARIVLDGDHVGNVYTLDDPLREVGAGPWFERPHSSAVELFLQTSADPAHG